MWQLGQDGDSLGKPVKALRGHSHFVSDVTLSSDGNFCLSSSWDGTLRLWDLVTGETTRQFTGHKKDALSVAFSPDNRQIVSGSRDKSIKLWCVPPKARARGPCRSSPGPRPPPRRRARGLRCAAGHHPLAHFADAGRPYPTCFRPSLPRQSSPEPRPYPFVEIPSPFLSLYLYLFRAGTRSASAR